MAHFGALVIYRTRMEKDNQKSSENDLTSRRKSSDQFAPYDILDSVFDSELPSTSHPHRSTSQLPEFLSYSETGAEHMDQISQGERASLTGIDAVFEAELYYSTSINKREHQVQKNQLEKLQKEYDLDRKYSKRKENCSQFVACVLIFVTILARSFLSWRNMMPVTATLSTIWVWRLAF